MGNVGWIQWRSDLARRLSIWNICFCPSSSFNSAGTVLIPFDWKGFEILAFFVVPIQTEHIWNQDLGFLVSFGFTLPWSNIYEQALVSNGKLRYDPCNLTASAKEKQPTLSIFFAGYGLNPMNVRWLTWTWCRTHGRLETSRGLGVTLKELAFASAADSQSAQQPSRCKCTWQERWWRELCRLDKKPGP